MDRTGWVTIGQIVAPHGVRGHVRVLPLTDFPERWVRLREVYVGDEPSPRRVELRGFVKGHMPVLRLEGVPDRNAAELLRGRYLSLPPDRVHPLPEDTYYVFQLRGLAAQSPDGGYLGRVADVESYPAHDVLVVATPDGRTVRVPAVKAFVQGVDLAAGVVVVRPIPGLFDEG